MILSEGLRAYKWQLCRLSATKYLRFSVSSYIKEVCSIKEGKNSDASVDTCKVEGQSEPGDLSDTNLLCDYCCQVIKLLFCLLFYNECLALILFELPISFSLWLLFLWYSFLEYIFLSVVCGHKPKWSLHVLMLFNQHLPLLLILVKCRVLYPEYVL